MMVVKATRVVTMVVNNILLTKSDGEAVEVFLKLGVEV